MSPLRRQPGVIEVEPANHRANVERSLHRIKLVPCARNARAMRINGPLHNRPQQLGACRILQRLQTAAQRIDQAIPCGLVRKLALDFIIQRVVSDIGENFIRLWPLIAHVR